MSLKVSVSGIRGIWGESLTLEELLKYTRAFGQMLRKRAETKRPRVLIGRDGRKTGPMIVSYVSSILNSLGIDVIDTGLVPTPTVLFGVREWDLDGGVIVTASHNPIEWNALKFVVRGGTFTTEQDLAEILEMMNAPAFHASWNQTGTTTTTNDIAQAHIERILAHIDVAAIQQSRFTVVLDPVNSAGGPITTKLLTSLGCRVIGINTEVTGNFARIAEPTPANLSHLPDIIRREKADIGFAQDPDADRLVVIDEHGRILSEEWTLALAVRHILSQNPGPVVVNLSTSLLSEMFARTYNQPCYYTKVGEANVVEGMKKYQARIGGEGNGGVIYPTMNLGRDSLVGIALILESLALSGKTLSALVADFPRLYSIKEKFSKITEVSSLAKTLAKHYPDATINTIDGVRMDLSRGNDRLWVHIRPSNTEPIMRLIGESTDELWLTSVVSEIHSLLG